MNIPSASQTCLLFGFRLRYLLGPGSCLGSAPCVLCDLFRHLRGCAWFRSESKTREVPQLGPRHECLMSKPPSEIVMCKKTNIRIIGLLICSVNRLLILYKYATIWTAENSPCPAMKGFETSQSPSVSQTCESHLAHNDLVSAKNFLVSGSAFLQRSQGYALSLRSPDLRFCAG